MKLISKYKKKTFYEFKAWNIANRFWGNIANRLRMYEGLINKSFFRDYPDVIFEKY